MATQPITKEQVEKKIIDSLVEFGADPDEMQPEATLEELEIDSLDLFELGQILNQEFVGSLQAKGLRERRVLRHVMKNAAPSALALMGLQFGYLLGGSILVETVYNWPGSGGLLNLAIFRRDIPVLSGTIVAIAAIFVVINIVVDVLQALIDPRIRR